MPNETKLADHLRTIARASVTDFRFQEVFRSPHYRGPAECFDDEREAAALLIELASYFTAPEPGVADLYFIGSREGPIKIGVSQNIAKRLKQLQTSHPYELEVLAVAHGGAFQEAEYHERFAEHRLTGEWFKRDPVILAEIDRINFGASPRQRTDPDHAAAGGLHG